jgi:uncharacterized Ntn-hydrolase superfamily protein
MDLETGDVGAAGASCVPVNATVLAALVPGKGVAATQAEFSIENRDKVFSLLQEGLPGEEILEHMIDGFVDPRLALRQYGIVTFSGEEVQAAGFTGERNFTWAGDSQSSSLAVSVQGNTLENEDVVGWSLEAFEAADLGPLSLPDRLMRALEAGSSAGGDRRCNNNDVQQTALSAFIVISRIDQPPFAALFSESTELDGPDMPWLYAAVIEEHGGPNPIIELRRQYDDWRESHLSPCPECDQNPIEVPAGGMSPDEPTRQPGSQEVHTPEPVVKQSETEPSVSITASISPQRESSAESSIQSAPWVPVLVLLFLAVAAAIIITIIWRSNTTKK